MGAKGYAALIFAVLIYEASKLYFGFALLNHVPFSASIPFLPEGSHASLQVLIPLAITGVAAMGAGYALHRAETRSLLAVSSVFMLIDAFLTLIVYGPGLAML